MTDTEINIAIHTYLGRPITATHWEFKRYGSNHYEYDTLSYSSKEVALAAQMSVNSRGYDTSPVEPRGLPAPIFDYCNDRDAMADAISKMKVHDTGGFTEELAPHWLDSEIQGDELIEFTLLIMTKPCRDLAVAFVKAIGKWKSTETP